MSLIEQPGDEGKQNALLLAITTLARAITFLAVGYCAVVVMSKHYTWAMDVRCDVNIIVINVFVHNPQVALLDPACRVRLSRQVVRSAGV